MSHPIHDQAERQKALNPKQSFIVQAPAGSGKTELLIQRYLTLLAEVNSPEEIIAITFTKKAASEMRERIIKALTFAATQPMPTEAHLKQTWTLAKTALEKDAKHDWHLIENPNQCRIQTIDALCAYLTGQLPLLSQFGASPTVTEDADAYYHETILQVIQQLEEENSWSKSLNDLLVHLDNDLNKLIVLLKSLLAKRDQWQPYLQFQSDSTETRAHLEAHLQTVVDELLTNTNAHFPTAVKAELPSILRFAASQLANSDIESPLKSCEFITDFPPATFEHLNTWRAIADLLLTKSEGKWRSRLDAKIGFPSLASLEKAEKKEHETVRNHLKNIIDTLGDNDALRKALYQLLDCPNPTYSEQQWSIIQAILNILKLACAQLTVTFRQQGIIDFIENAQAALLALGTDDAPTDLALRLDYQLKHILMDEFQDTSYTQYRLAHLLTLSWLPNEGKTLFIVGDPMQSIYRFRQAEVGLFLKMQQNGINHVQLHPIQLSVNFRSTAEIVHWNNFHFTKLFPEQANIATGAVQYHASVPLKETDASLSYVTIQGFTSDADTSQGAAIANEVKTLLEKYPEDSIAILVKARTHLSDIIPALKQQDIPYQAIDIDALSDNKIIQDVVSLTCALLHPADRIAWLSVLRAPWCGLSLADLTILAGQPSIIFKRANQDACVSLLSEDGQLRIRRVMSTLNKARFMQARLSLRDWVEQTWIALGGKACLQEPASHEIAQTYFELLQKMESDKIMITSATLNAKLKKLYAKSQSTTARLQIMTIHNAKGLEFDSVFIPHLEKKERTKDAALFLWMERPSAQEDITLLFAPIHETGSASKDKLYQYIDGEEKLKSEFELDRLLYVATTRAKKRLYLHYDIKHNKNNEISLQRGSFLQKLYPLFKGDAVYAESTFEASDEEEVTRALPQQSYRLPADWQCTETTEIDEVFTGTQARDGFQLPDETARHVGTVTHRLLQHLAVMGLDAWPAVSEGLIARLLTQCGVSVLAQPEAVSQVQLLVENTLSDKKGRWILSPHRDARSEWEITTWENNLPKKMIIDRTFIDEHDIRWIIDYKTTACNDEEIVKYQAQMNGYENAITQLDKRVVKKALYFPGTRQFVEV